MEAVALHDELLRDLEPVRGVVCVRVEFPAKEHASRSPSLLRPLASPRLHPASTPCHAGRVPRARDRGRQTGGRGPGRAAASQSTPRPRRRPPPSTSLDPCCRQRVFLAPARWWTPAARLAGTASPGGRAWAGLQGRGRDGGGGGRAERHTPLAAMRRKERRKRAHMVAFSPSLRLLAHPAPPPPHTHTPNRACTTTPPSWASSGTASCPKSGCTVRG